MFLQYTTQHYYCLVCNVVHQIMFLQYTTQHPATPTKHVTKTHPCMQTSVENISELGSDSAVAVFLSSYIKNFCSLLTSAEPGRTCSFNYTPFSSTDIMTAFTC